MFGVLELIGSILNFVPIFFRIMHSFRFRLSTLFRKYYNKTATYSETEELYQIMNSISDDELKELMREGLWLTHTDEGIVLTKKFADRIGEHPNFDDIVNGAD